MNAKRILCPLDFSENSQFALGYASSLAKEANAKLFLVYVDDSQVPYDAGFAAYVPPQGNTEILFERLREIKPTHVEVEHEHRLLVGHPADAIVDFADNYDIDLIVMGTHGRTGLARLVMGSIAEAVVRRADCPVLTVKHPEAVTKSAE